jgi:hypothetical protein
MGQRPICSRCQKRPVRMRPNPSPTEQIVWCMHCAYVLHNLEARDYEPGPEGFDEFWQLVNGGPDGVLSGK